MREDPVRFGGRDGTLAGVWHRPRRRGPHPAVLLLHGFTGNKAEFHFIFTRLARMLAFRGAAVLRFDFRGSGDSAGDFSEVTLTGERADARAAWAFMRRRAEVDPSRMAVLGMSMGGMMAACLAAETPDMKTAVLWSPVARPGELVRRRMAAAGQCLPEKYPRTNVNVDWGGWRIRWPLIREMLAFDPLRVARRIRCPSLLIHGSCDETVDVSAAHDYRKVVKNMCVHIVEGAGHTYDSVPWEYELLGVTLDWLGRELALAPFDFDIRGDLVKMPR